MAKSTRMTEIKRIEPGSYAKILACIYTIGAFIEGLVFALIFAATAGRVPHGLFFGSFGYWSVILFPIVGAIIGLVIGFVMSYVYNFAASKIGGVRVELSK